MRIKGFDPNALAATVVMEGSKSEVVYDFMRQTLSPVDITLLQQSKIALDPQNIFGIRNNFFAE